MGDGGIGSGNADSSRLCGGSESDHVGGASPSNAPQTSTAGFLASADDYNLA